jgi:hypothetical protein
MFFIYLFICGLFGMLLGIFLENIFSVKGFIQFILLNIVFILSNITFKLSM